MGSQSSNAQVFQSDELNLEVRISPDIDTVWLTRQQMAQLYDRDVKTIGKHISNALKEELESSTVAKFATVSNEGGIRVTRLVEHYNLDMIISVGYRVKSKRGVIFRRWANRVLKEYLLCNGKLTDKQAERSDTTRQLRQGINIIARIMARDEETDKLDAYQILDVVSRYAAALHTLDAYDHQQLSKPEGKRGCYRLGYGECRKLIATMRPETNGGLFGNEKDDSFKGSLGAIYQCIGDDEVYPSVEEKAANLLYFITKNHSFSDGNKRIAAAVFLHFLERNGILRRNGGTIISNHTLVAIVVMIAESRPEEKETMVRLVMHFLTAAEA